MGDAAAAAAPAPAADGDGDADAVWRRCCSRGRTAHDAARPLHAADVVAAHADFLLPALLPLPDPPPILCCSQYPLNSPRPRHQIVAFSVPRTYNIATREF